MSEIIPISDASDPRIAPYFAVRERDLAGREGRFVAEGEIVVRTLLSTRSRFRPESLLLAAGREPVLDRIADGRRVPVPVFVAPQPLMDRIVGFPIHRGILAIGRRTLSVEARSVLPPPGRPARIVGLIGLANHDNVGGIFRNAAAFAADAVLLDRTSCDPLYRKAIRVSSGAALTVPFAHEGRISDMLAALEAADIAVMTLSPAGRAAVEQVAWPRRLALLVGPEGPGLPPDLLSATRSVRIGMAPGHDSLNVATATAIVLHAARMP